MPEAVPSTHGTWTERTQTARRLANDIGAGPTSLAQPKAKRPDPEGPGAQHARVYEVALVPVTSAPG